MKKCTQCGAMLSDNDIVCPQCGKSVTPDIQVSAQENEQSPPEHANPKYDTIYNTPSNNVQQTAQQTEQYNNPYGQSYYQPPIQPTGQPINTPQPDKSKDKLVAGLLGILMGSLGIHKFYLGYNSTGVIMLLVSLLAGLFTFGIATIVMQVIGVIEGVMYLTESDEEFQQTYVMNEKKWF